MDLANLSGPLPSELANCTRLEVLSLSNNYITGTLPAELGDLLELMVLSVADNNMLTGTVPVDYAKLEQLTIFAIHDTQIMEPIPIEICSNRTKSVSVTEGTFLDCDCCCVGRSCK
jgi:hypothetical protein